MLEKPIIVHAKRQTATHGALDARTCAPSLSSACVNHDRAGSGVAHCRPSCCCRVSVNPWSRLFPRERDRSGQYALGPPPAATMAWIAGGRLGVV